MLDLVEDGILHATKMRQLHEHCVQIERYLFCILCT